jgi:hypothetical protein
VDKAPKSDRGRSGAVKGCCAKPLNICRCAFLYGIEIFPYSGQTDSGTSSSAKIRKLLPAALAVRIDSTLPSPYILWRLRFKLCAGRLPHTLADREITRLVLVLDATWI